MKNSDLVFYYQIPSNRDLFSSKVITISDKLGIDANWLMSVMMFESGLSPSVVNKYTGAVGLIQFMPSTALSLGTSISSLKEMSNLEQLYYVYMYLKQYAGKMNTFEDVYLSVFFPIAVGKKDDYILETSSLSASKIAIQNPAFDMNKDGKVTKSEIRYFLENWLKKKRLQFR